MIAVTITREQWEHRQPDGTLVVIQAGILDRSLYLGPDRIDPQPWMVEAAQACETCVRYCADRGLEFDHVIDCPDCHDGKPIVTIRVEVGVVERVLDLPDGPMLHPVHLVQDVGRAVHKWGPCQVYDTGPMTDEQMDSLDEAGDWIERDGGDLIWWHKDRKIDGTLCTRIAPPPGVDPASLVDQWAIGLQIEEGT